MSQWEEKDDLDVSYEEIGVMLDEGTPGDLAPALPGRATFVRSRRSAQVSWSLSSALLAPA